jgi:Tol biopolymer transport system component
MILIRLKTIFSNILRGITCFIFVIFVMYCAFSSQVREIDTQRSVLQWKNTPIILEALKYVNPTSLIDSHIVLRPDIVGNFECPAYSPDRMRIAVSYKDAPLSAMAGIWIVKWNGSYSQIISGNNTAPAWSPNSRYIAFTHHFNSSSSSIEIIELKTGDVRQLTDSKCLNDNPRWSPNGKLIAFSSNHSLKGTRNSFKIWLQRSNEKTPILLPHQPVGQCNFPRWSPDGSRILFTCKTDQEEKLYIVSLNGYFYHRLPISHLIGEPACWSPDGRKIAYIRYTSNEAVSLNICNPSGSHSQQINPPISKLSNNDFWPDW